MGTPNELGAELRRIRQMRARSLKAVATPAGISPAYLHKLEHGRIKKPSPSVLQRLAEALQVDYLELLALAGHPLPRQVDFPRPKGNLLRTALQSEELTEDEAKKLTHYLAFLRHERSAPG